MEEGAVLLHPFRLNRGEAKCAVVLPSGRQVAAGSSNGNIVMLPLGTEVDRIRLKGHTSAVVAVDVSSDSKILSVDASGCARIWIAPSYEDSGICFQVSEEEVAVAGFLADGNEIVVASVEGTVGRWSVTGSLLSSVRLDGKVGGGCAAVLGVDRGLYIPATRARLEVPFVVSAASVCGHAGLLAAGSPDGQVVVIESDAQSVVGRIGLEHGVGALAFHPLLPILAAGTDDGRVTCLRAPSLQRLLTLSPEQGAISSLSWGPDGDLLASVGSDNRILVWRTNFSVAEPEAEVGTCTFSEEEEEEVAPAPPPVDPRIAPVVAVVRQVEDLTRAVAVLEERVADLEYKITVAEAKRRGK